MNKAPHFNLHDTTICIWSETQSDWDLYKKIRHVVKQEGFTWIRDPRIVKQYKSLAKTHHYGRCRDLEFCAEIHPALMKLEFFQNINFENKAGGKYDFNKTTKMPYLMRLQFQKVMGRVEKLLLALGYKDTSRRILKNAYDQVMARRAEIEEFHGAKFYEKERLSYNILDGDGVPLHDGDLRYYRDHKGYLCRGRVYHNLNNMWWVVTNHSHYTNLGSYQFFSWRPGLARKKYYKPENRLQHLLEDAVTKQNFEKAIIYRDLLAKAG